MTVAADRAALRSLTETLLAPRTDSTTLQEAAEALYGLCARLAEFDEIAAPDASLQLTQGVALDVLSAASCIRDATRTSRFLQGVRAAVEVARSRFESPVRVLYAGCGPFAPLALPLTTVLSPEHVRFTLLNVDPGATDLLLRLVHALDAATWIDAVKTADALEWRATSPPHVIVVECMQRALTREPQVALMRHLAPQLAPGGLFVPQEIRLDACLADLRHELGAQLDEAPLSDNAQVDVELGTIMDLRAAALQHGAAAPAGPVQVVVPAYAGAERHLLVRTLIRVFESVMLGDRESGITQPLVMHALGHVASGTRLEFRYEYGPDPGPRCRVVG